MAKRIFTRKRFTEKLTDVIDLTNLSTTQQNINVREADKPMTFVGGQLDIMIHSTGNAAHGFIGVFLVREGSSAPTMGMTNGGEILDRPKDLILVIPFRFNANTDDVSIYVSKRIKSMRKLEAGDQLYVGALSDHASAGGFVFGSFISFWKHI